VLADVNRPANVSELNAIPAFSRSIRCLIADIMPLVSALKYGTTFCVTSHTSTAMWSTNAARLDVR